MKTMSGRSALVCSFFVLTLILASLSQASFAQGLKSFASKGCVELGGSISYESETYINTGSSGLTVHILSVSPIAGYFLADGFEISVEPLGITHSWFSGSSFTEYMIFAAPSYNFKTESIVYPFVEVLLGYTGTTQSGSYLRPTSGFSWGGRGGVKLAVSNGCLLNLGLQYLQITENESGASSRSGWNQFSLAAGFSVWF